MNNLGTYPEVWLKQLYAGRKRKRIQIGFHCLTHEQETKRM